MSLFFLLGFRIFVFGAGIICCWFKHDDHVDKTAMTAFCMILGYVSLRVYDIEPEYIKPFASPICVLGGNTLYIALIILSS